MNLLQVIMFTESLLCRLIGLYSPWLKTFKWSVFYRITLAFVYTASLVLLPFLRLGDDMYRGQVSYILANLTVFLIVMEIYLTLFKYNNINRNVFDFKGFLFEKRLFTKVATKVNDIGLAEVTCFHHFLLLITKCVMIILLTVRFALRPMIVTCTGIVRTVIATALLCQWSLCMHHLEHRALNLQGAVKTILEPIRGNVFPLIKEIRDSNTKNEKHMNLKKFDTFISEYRLLADQHRIINDYYGVHLMLHVSVTVYCLLLVWYRSWFCANKSTKCHQDDQSYLVIHALIELAGITLTALISESASQKVIYIQSSMFIMMAFSNFLFLSKSYADLYSIA